MTKMQLTGPGSGVTAIPNGFLDRYLPEADGEYVKIYLVLWRFFCEGKGITVGQLADLLDDTERDVMRGLRYWDKKGLLQLSCDGKKEITGICFLPIPEAETVQKETAATSVVETEEKPPVSVPEKNHAPSSAVRKELAADEDFGQLIYIVGKYLGKPLTATGSDVLGYLYGELGMRADLLEYLVETCVDAGHKSLHYMEKIALDWHEKGIRTVDQAREQAEICRKQYYQVLKAFGLSRRGPAPEEKKVMDIWFYDYGFQLDIVLEACSRTIRNLHEPSFEYAGGILADWKKKGVRNKGDIEALDLAFSKEREGKRGQRKEAAKPNRFHNFDQVGYDYDAIVQELNG